jgi:hypothetical protein
MVIVSSKPIEMRVFFKKIHKYKSYYNKLAILGYVFSYKPLHPMATRHGHEHLPLLLVDK